MLLGQVVICIGTARACREFESLKAELALVKLAVTKVVVFCASATCWTGDVLVRGFAMSAVVSMTEV